MWHPRLRPQEGAGGRVVARQRHAVHDHHLRPSQQRHQNGRRVGRVVRSAAPDARAGPRVVGHQRLAVTAAGADDHLAVEDERRAASAPLRVGRLVVGGDVLAPEPAARAEVQHVEPPGGPQRRDVGPRNRRRRARAVAGNHRVVADRVAMRPARRPRKQVVHHHHLARAPLLLRDRQAAVDGKPRPPGADRYLPDQLRRMRRPVTGQPNAGDDARAGGA